MDRRPSLLPPADADHYDDLSELERERYQNDMRLKNTFEHIFEKYSRDFSGIGDEIDLETGEIVVNNGHIVHIQDERDTGEGFDDWEEGDDDDDNGLYDRYELGDSEGEEEDELLSSPPRNNHGRTFTTGQPSIAHTSQNRNHFATPRSARPSARPAVEPQRTPQGMDLANDPAFFQALGQSIAQGIAQYMTSYGNDTRPADPVWDAPPLPRPSHSVRRSTSQTQRRRPMIPESPRHPSSRSIWASGRAPGRPRVRPHSSTNAPTPSPSIRNNELNRQMLASGSPERPRHHFAYAEYVQYEDNGEEEFQDDDQVEVQDEYQDTGNAWAEHDDPLDLDHAADPEIPARPPQATEIPRERPARTEDRPPANYPGRTVQDARTREKPSESLQINFSSTSDASGDTREADAAMRTESAPQQSATKTPNGRTGRPIVRDAPWTAEEAELLIELREVRKASFPQCARYFPTRGPKNIENHYYKHLMNRPDKDGPRGEMSEVVRRAIERGPILANRPRMKPYNPKNPENARPNRANLADPKELLQDTLPFVADSESGSEALSGQEGTATPPAQVTPQTPFSAAEEEGVYRTGDAKKPWACKRCGKAWGHKSGFKYHLAVPTRCKPPISLQISQMAPAGVVPRGLDIQNGRPANFNPNILIREEMERTYLCIRCGKSWASHSNARQHTKHPEQCMPDNWAINYDPGAHRKRKAADGLATPAAGQSSKRTKKDESARLQRLETAAQPLAEPSPLAAREDGRGRQIDGIAGEQEGVESTGAIQWTPDATPEPSSLPRRGFPQRFTISDKPQARKAPENQIPIDPALESMFEASKVLEVVQQHMNPAVQDPEVSSKGPPRPQSSAVRRGNGGSSSAGAAAAAGSSSGSSSKGMVQAAHVQKTTPRTAPADPARSSAKNANTLHMDAQRTTSPHRPTQPVDLAGRPISGPSPTRVSRPEPEPVPHRSASKAKAKPVEKLQKHDTALKSSSNVMPRAKDVGVKPSSSKLTPKAKDVGVKPSASAGTSKVTKSQPAKTAPKASSAQKLQSKVRMAMTPQAKRTGEGARSSPLIRAVASEPRPRTSFADLLLDESEDELAF
ncbi:hypothetical protein SLS56_008667 [Neofusicoccum ribis]|uniref:C2H2-type domain-containing protein n=1 Tax=Neofusicoccum ribis TaxID=45134 RepID=A0ABR3SJG6_9PEZI